MITLEEIAAIAEPISDIYAAISDDLMINIAKHFNSGKYLNDHEWAFKKLGELGTLNKESIKIIAKRTGQTPEMIEAALESAALKATEELEDDLKNKRQLYGKSIQKMYLRRNSQDKLLFILSADNFAQSFRRMRYTHRQMGNQFFAVPQVLLQAFV